MGVAQAAPLCEGRVMKKRQTIVVVLFAALGVVSGLMLWLNRPPEDATGGAPLGVQPNESSAAKRLAVQPRQKSFESVLKPALAEFRAALRTTLTESDEALRQEKQDALLQNMALADIPDALDYLGGQPPTEFTEGLMVQLVRRWAEDNPRAAADWIAQHPMPCSAEARNGVAIVWANQDFAKALEWVRQWPDPQERGSGLLSIAYEEVRTQPLEALKLAVELPASSARDDLVKFAATQWGATDPEAAAAWAEQIGDAGLGQRTLAMIATVWGETDPAAAARLALDALPPGREQDDAVVGIVQRWVQQEPETAVVWVEQFPEGKMKQAALENAVKLWADKDVQQVGDWLNSLSAGTTRDAAVAVFSSWLTPAFPAVAARWAESIGEDGERQRQMAWVAQNRLVQEDPFARP